MHKLETNMESIMVHEYERLLDDMWWPLVAATKNSETESEIMIWLLETAMITSLDEGSMDFASLIALQHKLTAEFAGAGMRLQKKQLEDVFNGIPGGKGLNLAGEWSRQIGIQAAYWPQNLVADAIRKGADATSLTYDKLPYFHDAHFVNGVDAEDGTYANHITAAVLDAAGLGAGAPSIHEFGAGAVTVDVAFQNLQRVFSYMASVKMPNGRDPRKLRPVGILVPPTLSARAQQATNAKTIAQAASAGGGGADVDAIIRNWGIGQPTQADELGANFGGSDTSYYIIAAPAGQDGMGALTYVNREPFNVVFHGPQDSQKLARIREFQWLTGGRNVVGYGHPYKLFRVDAA